MTDNIETAEIVTLELAPTQTRIDISDVDVQQVALAGGWSDVLAMKTDRPDGVDAFEYLQSCGRIRIIWRDPSHICFEILAIGPIETW